MELSIVGKGEEQVFSVGRDAWYAGTLADCLGIEDEAARAKTMGRQVEVAGVDIVVQ